jgi:hypothetical protein
MPLAPLRASSSWSPTSSPIHQGHLGDESQSQSQLTGKDMRIACKGLY